MQLAQNLQSRMMWNVTKFYHETHMQSLCLFAFVSGYWLLVHIPH